MNTQFVTYEIASELKELGFDEPCLTSYSNLKQLMSIYAISELILDGEDLMEDTPERKYCHPSILRDNFIAAPLWQQVIDWFRLKHKIEIEVTRDINGFRYMVFNSGELNSCISDFGIKSFEEAREQAILEAIKLIK